MSVTIGLRHMGRLPRGALASDAVPYGMDTGGWVLATHLVDLCWQNLKGDRNATYYAFKDLLEAASQAFELHVDVVALFLLTVESDKSRFE
eukprot:15432347-Alexandrium_andersonii.AAC.1